jgi:hypothetical protein
MSPKLAHNYQNIKNTIAERKKLWCETCNLIDDVLEVDDDLAAELEKLKRLAVTGLEDLKKKHAVSEGF